MNLDEIEARANAATPGPWTPQTIRLIDGVDLPDATVAQWQRDAAFIAHARTDVPALIARVRELEAECDHERALLECAPWATYSEGETLLRAQAAEAQQLARQVMDERDKLRAECAALRREIAQLMDDH